MLFPTPSPSLGSRREQQQLKTSIGELNLDSATCTGVKGDEA